LKNAAIIVGFFIFLFTIIFFAVRYSGLPSTGTSTTAINLPWLFSAISLIFSIVSGFIIQSKWQTWNELIDATHGEVSTLKQLHTLANHFPVSVQKEIRTDINEYLEFILSETSGTKAQPRSQNVERAIYKLEETVLDIDYSEHPNIGSLAFDLVRKTLEYREKRLQNAAHTLPRGVRFFTLTATTAIILSSLFVNIDVLAYDYIFTLIIALLSFGVYLLIDDLDHPYRPGQWQLTKDEYRVLHSEITESLKHPVETHKK
jgi:hypothetical protein